MNKIMLALGFFGVIFISGCSTQHIINSLASNGRFSFTPVESANYDYSVKIDKVFDGFGFDTTKPEDRMLVVKQLLGNLCLNPTVINEDYIDRGKTPVGASVGSYLLKIKCR